MPELGRAALVVALGLILYALGAGTYAALRGSPCAGPTTVPARLTFPGCSSNWLGRSDGVAPPAKLV